MRWSNCLCYCCCIYCTFTNVNTDVPIVCWNNVRTVNPFWFDIAHKCVWWWWWWWCKQTKRMRKCSNILWVSHCLSLWNELKLTLMLVRLNFIWHCCSVAVIRCVEITEKRVPKKFPVYIIHSLRVFFLLSLRHWQFNERQCPFDIVTEWNQK